MVSVIWKAGKRSYREDNHNFCRTRHNDCQEESHFKPLERFVNDDVLNLGSRYKGCSRAQQEVG